MSTNATMAYRLTDGELWMGVYQHSDGYPEGPSPLPARMQAYIDANGADALRDLIIATPQGFSYFEPSGAPAGARDLPYGAYGPGEADTMQVGVGDEQGDGMYTYVLELDGTIRQLSGARQ
jgi:hypothetical protein